MKNKKLDFSSKKQKNSRELKYFLIAFSAFVVVLGTVSLLMFMRSLDFDLSNLAKPETTTEVITETTTKEIVMAGGSDIIVLCNDSGKNISFAFLMSTDMADKTIKVCNLDSATISIANNMTAPLSEHFVKYGITGFVHAVEDYSGISVDKYIVVDETQFKSFVAKTGDVTVDVATAIDAKASGGLSLDAGQQKLSGDLLLKYIKYCDQPSRNAVYNAFLSNVMSPSNVNAQDNLFSFLVNNSKTDISIVDYTNRKDTISAFITGGGKIESVDNITQISGVSDEEKN